MKFKFLFLTLAFFSCFFYGYLPANAQMDSISFGNGYRYYKKHVPKEYSNLQKIPLLIALHGWQRDPDKMEYHSHLSEKADSANFIVVYPKGTGNPLAWNLENSGVDDAGFLNALIDSIKQKFNIDTAKIFMTGFSNGSSMTYKFAQKYSNKICAIAGVGGAYWDNKLTPSRKIPIIHFHALNDNAVSIGTVKPVLQKWSAFNECTEVADTFYLTKEVTGKRWASEDSKSDVVIFETKYGQHSWPGGEYSWAQPTMCISATDLLWDFFTASLPTLIENEVGIKTLDINSQDGVCVFPTYVRDELYVNSNFDCFIEIYNISGEMVIKHEVLKAEVNYPISVKCLKSGSYFYKVINDGRLATNGIFFKQ